VPARTLVIANPRSGGGATGRHWARIERTLRETLGEFELRHTTAPRHAQELARDAVAEGFDCVVAAGGDGTASEIASGLLELSSPRQRPALGLLPLGTGGDLRGGLAVPGDVAAAARAIASGRSRRIDAGRLDYRGPDEKPARAHFLNIASFGLSGAVDRLVASSPRLLGGTAAFAIASVRAILRDHGEPVTIRIDGEAFFEGPIVLGTAANGFRFGGGMRVAPEASLDDGRLDCVVVEALPKRRLVGLLARSYRGRHLDDAAVHFQRGRVVEAEARPGRVWLDVDGEALGTLPARFEVLPGAIEVRGVAAGG